jgi:hypothetical protein
VSRDVYGGGYVPRLLLTVGFFLIGESLTYIGLALRANIRVDFVDFAFVFGSAVIIAIVGFAEARRDRPDSVGPHSMGTILGAILLGVVLGICGGFVAYWFLNLQP